MEYKKPKVEKIELDRELVVLGGYCGDVVNCTRPQASD